MQEQQSVCIRYLKENNKSLAARVQIIFSIFENKYNYLILSGGGSKGIKGIESIELSGGRSQKVYKV